MTFLTLLIGLVLLMLMRDVGKMERILGKMEARILELEKKAAQANTGL